MKTFKFFMAMTLMALGFCALTSCSEDKDEPATPAARNIEGSYTGDMTGSVMGDESVFEDVTFTITATSDNTVDITVSSFGEPPMQVPSFTARGVKVTGADGSYTLASTEFEGTLASGSKMTGTMQGTYSNSRLNLNLSLQLGAMPMPIICTFSSPKN